MKRLAVVLVLCTVASAQDLGVKAPPQKGPIAVVNGTVHPVSGAAIPNGYVLFDEGRIVEVGTMPESFGERVRQIDVAGKHVYPGLVGAWTRLGLTEIGAVRATRDTDEVGAITPEVRAAVAVNPDSTLLPVARSNGVLTVASAPDGGAIPGRLSVLRLAGWTWEDMTVRDDAGLVVDWPSFRPVHRWWMEKSDEEQKKDAEARAARIREAFDLAAAWRDARAADPATPVDLRWQAMTAVLPKPGGGAPDRPVFFPANDFDQIEGAVRFAAERGLRAVIVGGRDADRLAPLLVENGVGVIVTGTWRLPSRSDSDFDESYRLPARLEAAGVDWCMASGESAANERNLPYAAAIAVAHGLDPEVALRSITLSAAKLLGLGDELGSLDKGKRATLIVTDGDPLEIATHVERAFVDGSEIDLGNKQTALAAKYREKYRQLGLIR